MMDLNRLLSRMNPYLRDSTWIGCDLYERRDRLKEWLRRQEQDLEEDGKKDSENGPWMQSENGN